MQDFRKLKVWQKSHRLVLMVYAVSANFPRAETFGITTQVRRAAVSIAANIAEGSARSGDKELTRFLYISMGSASELEYFAVLVADLGFLERDDARRIEEDACEIKRMLTGLIASTRRSKSEADS